MAGIYIHIPFCKKACSYCDFHFTTNRARENELVRAITEESAMRAGFFGDEKVQSIYFGGGTPSLLSEDHIRMILKSVRENFRITESPEITVEANPDDLDAEKLESLMDSGVNRLSIGIQSFNQSDLELMGRAHDSEQALECVELAAGSGFKNISIDLIYGLPARTNDEWKKNLKIAFELPVTHLSCYGLTVEPGTLLHKQVKEGIVTMPEEEMINEQFDTLHIEAIERNYRHYEISNLGKPGYESYHNTGYWESRPYLGLGPSAHSYRNQTRHWNPRSNAVYMSVLATGSLPEVTEKLTGEQVLNESLMVSLRTDTGLNLKELSAIADHQQLKLITAKIKEFKTAGLGTLTGDKFVLNMEGWKICDRLTSELFV